MLNAFAAALKGGNPPTLSTHRLRRGLPGYLILFAPHAFEPQRQLQTRKPPSPLVFLHISTHFTATHGIPLSSSALKSPSFTPNKSGQRLPPTYYRGCWHVVSRGFLVRYRQGMNFPLSSLFFSNNRVLRSENLLHSRGVARSDLRPLPKIPYCCLP